MTGRSREYLAALVLLAAGALLGLAAAGRTWGTAEVTGGLAAATEDVAGRELVPYAPAVAWLALAALLAVPATRRTGRRVVGGVVALAGLALLVGAFRATAGLADRVAERAADGSGTVTAVQTSPGWAAATVVAGLAVAAAGAWVAFRGSRWPGMGSRFERGRPRRAGARDAWDALDRGEDPTSSPP